MSKAKNIFLPFVAFVAVFFVITFIIKKIIEALNTEAPVMDETSKKILKNKNLTQKYYEAIEKEKNGEQGKITVEGEEYNIVRAGNYNASVKAL